jgi:hypothetical protein
MEEENVKYINAYKWKPTTVQEMLTFFGILINAMLFPQTGQRMRDSWDDPVRNPWTCHMSKGRFQQLCVMLHFNNNEDTDRIQNDSLHKIRPLLNILKKTIGWYAELGSEFSFDEDTMACYSRYARNLVSFNPMKPTRKFHFKL